MRNLIKKSLAFLLVATLALTCFVGTLTVSAENATPTATITVVAADDVVAGATEIPVTLTVESEVGINEALIKVSSDLGTIAAEATLVSSDAAAKIEYAEGTTDFGAFYLSALSPEGTENTELGEVTYAEIEVVFTNEAGIAAKETPYTVNVEIPEGKVIAASKDEVAIDLVCDGLEIVVEEVASCDHANATKEVTTQPTKDAEGVMTYTCECGETWTEAIAKPISLNEQNSIMNHALYLAEVVGDQIGVNRTVNSNGVINRGYSDYFLEVTYMSYGDKFVLEKDTKVFYPEEKSSSSTAKVDYFIYKNVALSEMAKQYTCTLYCLDKDGVVVAYQENITSIREQALSYVKKYSSNTPLVTACVDMMNYGAALQEYFAKLNVDTPIDGAELPTVGFEAYDNYASDESLVPELINTVAEKKPLKDDTKILAGNATLEIGSSNLIRGIFRCGSYDPSLVTIVASYKSNSGADIVTEPVALSSLSYTGTTTKTYNYTFDKLSVYDVNEYVTFTLSYNGTPEYSYKYSIDTFVNTYIKNDTYADVLTKLELFGRAVRVYKGFN